MLRNSPDEEVNVLSDQLSMQAEVLRPEIPAKLPLYYGPYEWALGQWSDGGQ